MKIALKLLIIVNFKGIKYLEVPFRDLTDIMGDNAKGKTSVVDAYAWLMTGKDSTDRKDFEIKTLDENNKPIEKIEHSVTGVFEVNGEETILKRVLKEKWVKKRGVKDEEFTGNETLYYWNDVPMRQGDFQSKINALVDESIFKLVTNPFHFNNIDWQKRRNVLMELAGNLSNADIAAGQPQFDALLKSLSNKTIDEYKRELSSKKKKINDDLKAIPTRIDELRRSMPETLNYASIEKSIADKEKEMDGLRESVVDKNKAYNETLESHRAVQNEVYNLKRECDKIKHSVRAELEQSDRDANQTIDTLKRNIVAKKNAVNDKANEVSSLELKITQAKAEVDRYESQRKTHLDRWHAENEKSISFKENEFKCDKCSRDYETDDITRLKEELTSTFNANKAKILAEIQADGKQAKQYMEEAQAKVKALEDDRYNAGVELENLEGDYQQIEKDIASQLKQQTQPAPLEDRLAAALEDNTDYTALLTLISEKEEFLSEAPKVDTSELVAKGKTLSKEVDALKLQLASKDQIEKGNKRISELEKEEQTLVDQLNDLEASEFSILEFDKAKMDKLEERINGRFQLVKFKLFDRQINGGEKPCCDILVNTNGNLVPISDANNAGRINAGLDIINTLSDHHKVYAPVFVDNAESVNHLIPIQSQLTRLIVTNDPELKISA